MKPIIAAPFDRKRTPPRQNPFFLPLIWPLCWFFTRRDRLTILKENMDGLKPPFLVLGTHHSFMDFYVTPLALFPYRANYVSELEGFENYGEWLYRQAGCLGTRKFVNDISLIKNIKKVLSRKDILVLYPEARYANVGTSCALPASLGKLVKQLKVPVVTLQMQGNYLQSPIWNLKPRHGAPLKATLKQLFTRENIHAMSVHTINQQLANALSYDEYAWQYENKFHIDTPYRAEGLERVLYQCPHCHTTFQMRSAGANLFCDACQSQWHMTSFGNLTSDTNHFSHIPDWYEWQRKQVQHTIDAGQYQLTAPVRIESLPNAKNFIPLGEGTLVQNEKGFFLTFTDYNAPCAQTLRFSYAGLFSLHTEYDYRGKGQCIVLSTVNNSYFIYPLAPGFNVTQIQFATEYFHCKRNAYRL